MLLAQASSKLESLLKLK